MFDYLSPEQREFERGAIDPQEAKQMLIASGAFKGYEPEEYSDLLDLIVKFVVSSRCKHLEAYKELIEGLVKLTHGTKLETISTKIEPTITAKFLADQIRPWVEDIREALFHKKVAPFKCNEDAEKWLDEAEKGIEEWLEKLKERLKRHEEYHACLDALYEKYSLFVSKWDAWGDPPIEHPTQEEMQHFTEAEQRRVMSLKPGEPIEESEQVKAYIGLRDNTQKISEVTGFTIESVRMYILADVLPVLPSVTLGIVKETHPLPSGISLLNRYAKVTIRGDITKKDLRSLYLRIRRELGIRHLKSLSEQNIRLCEMVAQRGGIPEEGVMAFWKSMKEEWNKRYRGKYRTYTTVQGIQIAYKRIMARLERRMIQKGGTK